MKDSTKEALKQIGLLTLIDLGITVFIGAGGIVPAVLIASSNWYIVRRFTKGGK